MRHIAHAEFAPYNRFVPPAGWALGERNDVVVAGLNRKRGSRGTSNCLLNFGDGQIRPGGLPGTVGELVGEEGRGLACRFHIMNEARISAYACRRRWLGLLDPVERVPLDFQEAWFG